MVKPFFSGATKIFGQKASKTTPKTEQKVASTSSEVGKTSKAPETSIRDHHITSVVSRSMTKTVVRPQNLVSVEEGPFVETCPAPCYDSSRTLSSQKLENLGNGGIGTFTIDIFDSSNQLVNTVTLTSNDGKYYEWEATQLGVISITMKGGTTQRRYIYDGTSLSGTGLHSPVNASGQPALLSNVVICVDPIYQELDKVVVSSSATLHCFKYFDYQVSCPTIEAQEVDQGQQDVVVPFDVTVKSVDTGTDCNILGSIEITPNSSENLDFSASVKLFDSDGGEISSAGIFLVDPVENNGKIFIGFEGSFSLSPGQNFGKYTVTVVSSLQCDESRPQDCVCPSSTQTVDGQISESFTTNVCPDDGSCIWVIKVSDSNLNNFIKEVLENCGTDKEYSFDIPFNADQECGTYTIDINVNLSDCNGATEGTCSTSFTVDIVGCDDGGCTLTQGYWKTHSTCGPVDQKRDDAWDLVGEQAEQTPFFKSGATYCSVMWIKPKGLKYYVMARQYVAAVLNQLNGADSEAIGLALQVAEYLFTNYTPNQLKDLSNETITIDLAEGGSITDTIGNLVNDVIVVLTNYNEGIIGPGHCEGLALRGTSAAREQETS